MSRIILCLQPENLDAITCSYKIILCQACKFYHSWHQLWSHDTVVLLLVTSIHVKRVNCYVYYDLFCYTGRFCLLTYFFLVWSWMFTNSCTWLEDQFTHVWIINVYCQTDMSFYYDLFCYTGRFCLLRLRTTGSLPTVCKQRMILDICYGLWLIMIDTKIFWFQMISTISWLIKL
jgi:hypothetical protein